jgi:hypothetical protein
MATMFNYRNRAVTDQDIAFVRELIKRHPQEGRCSLSKRVCRAWKWTQPNGQLKDMICRGLLLRLEREGYVQLPARKFTPHNPLANRKDPPPVEVDQSPVERSIKELLPITFRQVRRTADEHLFNSLIAQFHYLGYTQPVGEHLKYLVSWEDRPIACLAWSSAPWHLACRDRYIGWSPERRRRNLHLLAYNTRFLILPFIRVPHLASHLLARCAKIIASDWQTIYHHSVYWLETFVDPERFRGTCYRAANWILLGKTTGRGKLAPSQKPTRSIKDVYGYPLVPDFRGRLCHG